MVQQVDSAGVAITAFENGSLSSTAPIIISDTVANIQTDLDFLQPLAVAADVSSVTLTPGGSIPVLSITTAQAISDVGILKDISGLFATVETAPVGASTAIAGVGSAIGDTVVFSGPASLYTIAAQGNGVNFTVAGNGFTDHLSNVQVLDFSGSTVVVAQAPGSGSVVTSGNIAELFAAVLGRQPDAPGLGYYESILTTAPNIPLTTYAQWFLASPEYTAAHSYAATAAGDAQFITDSYSNLLGRTPAASELAYYQNTVIAPFLVGLTPGTAAYAAADTLAHAYVITDFSASAEFLADVQITGNHPSSASHWLVLI